VSSELGEGTTFAVYFPRAAGLVTADMAVPAAMPRGTERLLLVEDESSVRDVAERTLRALGYQVTTATDGVEAQARIEQAGSPYALVITDVRMPRMGGAALAALVEMRWPRQRLVFMSGHADGLMDGSFRNGVTVLPKPFTASELAVCVREALDKPV
jgi:CheY-like chemotaxis protein